MIHDYFFLVPLAAAAGNLILALVVLRRDPLSPLNRAFGVASASMILWNLNFWAYSAFLDEPTAFFWSRLFRCGTLFMPPTALHFIFVFSGHRPRWVRHVLGSAYAISSALAVANLADLLVVDLVQTPWGFYFVPTPLYRLFSFEFFSCSILILALLIHQFLVSGSPRKRLQSRLWLIGTLIALPLGLTHLVLRPTVHMPPLGNIANTFYVGVIAYSIVRYRLLDIDLVMARTLTHVIVAAILALPIVSGVTILQFEWFGTSDIRFSLIVLAISCAGWIVFPLLRSRLEATIESSLLRRKQEYRSQLVTLSRTVLRIIDRQRLASELVTTLSSVLNLERVCLLLGNRDNLAVECEVGPTFAAYDPISLKAVARYLLTRNETIIVEEVEEDSSVEAQAVAAAMRSRGWQVCIPLLSNAQLVGLIGLGSAKSRAGFTLQDFELLEMLAGETAVALENIRLIEELNRSRDLIQRADRSSSLGVLAAGIAHEIRNPLVAIQTFFQLAPERIYDEEFVTSFLETSAGEVKRISGLINELLSFAKSPVKSFGMITLSEVAEGVLVLLGPEARRQRIQLVLSVGHNLPPLWGNAEQLRQVLLNLAFNSVQASAPGGVVEILIEKSEVGDSVLLRVVDKGCGIESEQLKHVFDPFFTTKSKGTGLGLAIVQQIVAEHGGSIAVESVFGAGSSFTIRLPAGSDT